MLRGDLSLSLSVISIPVAEAVVMGRVSCFSYEELSRTVPAIWDIMSHRSIRILRSTYGQYGANLPLFLSFLALVSGLLRSIYADAPSSVKRSGVRSHSPVPYSALKRTGGAIASLAELPPG